MIDFRTPSAGLSGDDQRRLWLAAPIAVLLLLAGGMFLPTVWSSARAFPAPSSSPSGPVPPSVSAGSAAEGPVAPPSAPVPVVRDRLSLPGRVPSRGSGRFDYAPGRSKILGTAGAVRRFRVAVERGSGESPAAFAADVEAVLGDRRGWIGSGRLRLQRVAGPEAAAFTVYLATRDTAGRMCADGGVAIAVGGRPYTSCRTAGRAVINLDRWRLSARPYVAARVPLTVYRQYVVNHEVGHELGRHHEGCPRRGGPAPVMVQQTLTLRGCVPYAWPYRGGRLWQGPPV
ncbi:DUF3152 domain-containing protein [Pseudosporangium ferrugineum]|uniref:Uncharacterized protein DUF3152 n=1 Tax=Pseudosporangium ferrugineum TaxID=439699 RepID=A0A2T0RMN6_9ACTN|nr:DUF3152 domain-containing protein [Pseudosporangium ferrugineum]PRY22401.1 uncharacterized protein DUF3152 [Pseudosporangium ferrugineum]